jgi:hypothetical protein
MINRDRADEVFPASSALTDWARTDPTGFRQWLITEYPEKLTTGDHAALAAAAVDAHRQLTGRDPLPAGGRSPEYEDSLADLLADLMHYASRHAGHFGRALDSARQTYARECEAEMTDAQHEQLENPGPSIAARPHPAWLAAWDAPLPIRDGLLTPGELSSPQQHSPPPVHRRGQSPRRRYGN